MIRLRLLPALLMFSMFYTFHAQAQAIVADESVGIEVTSPVHVTRASLASRALYLSEQMREESIDLPVGDPPSRLLRLGDEGDDVAWLIAALVAHGYLEAATVDDVPDPALLLEDGHEALPAVFDTTVDHALRNFQQDKGLGVDGVAGRAVYGALTADNSRLASALGAWGQAVQAWSDELRAAGYSRAIIVNIASFTLHAINLNTDEVEIESRVIVGKPSTRTPRMLSNIINLKANPDWTPPKSIRGARYQRPGPNNALGLMRFSMDNNMSIYLHDTNARGLFDRDYRALSAGCVRVQKWHELAAWSANQDAAWVDDVALVGGKTRFLKVDPIPVLLVYSRADIVSDQPRAFDDVYNLGDAGIGNAALNGRSEAAPVLFGLEPVASSLY